MGDKKQKITIQQKPLKFKTEDEVRDDAGRILGFKNSEKAMSGVGQLTSFVKLGFNGKPDRPDGWYLPFDLSEPAIILETKNSDVNLSDEKWIAELDKNVLIVKSKYKKVLGILYNGQDVLVFKDGQLVETKNVLFAKEYYLKLFNQNTIDKQLIYKLTKDINENLHSNFGMKNLIHRMVFTACALVAKRYGAVMVPGMNWGTLHSSILSTLNKSYQEARRQNQKLDLITDCFKEIKSNLTENQQAIDSFIDRVGKISENIDSDYWNGEDVMAIFFNEFTRYKGKSEQGQVFTPDHITSLIYRITGTNYTDKVLDACCGSGAFLVKAMSNMIREVGGVNNEEEVQKIKSEKLFGIEFDKDMFALACANMLIHKDGKTNLDQNDARTLEAGKWIKTKGITKVLMNPPYENKYGCLKIVENVLDNVFSGAICAFILPDTKLEVHKGKIQKWFQRHSLLKIIKLPDIFAGMAGVDTSIFIFKAGEPQNNKPIFACWIKDDGLETVKNQGRHDTKNKWQEIEEFWVNVIYKQSGDDSVQWLKPEEDLCYQVPEEPFKMNEKDFKKTILDFVLFESDIDEKELKKAVLDYVLYESPLEGGELKKYHSQCLKF